MTRKRKRKPRKTQMTTARQRPRMGQEYNTIIIGKDSHCLRISGIIEAYLQSNDYDFRIVDCIHDGTKESKLVVVGKIAQKWIDVMRAIAAGFECGIQAVADGIDE